jgi:hypothetical protein
MPVLLLQPIQNWYCPSCHLTDQTLGKVHPNRMHPCPKMHGLTTPMLLEGVKGKHVQNDPEGYVGDELVQHDDRGRPVMNIVTVRDEGQDCTVYAPTARNVQG